MQIKEPRILVISEFFEAGDAITTLNLFSKWSKKQLFCASRAMNSFSNKFNTCYILGREEVKYIYPLNKLKKIPTSGILKVSESLKENRVVKRNNIYSLFEIFLKFFGIIQYVYKIKLSKGLEEWIEEISPDYIYTAVCSIYMARFIKSLMIKYPHIKFIIHNYDDWTEPPYVCVNKFPKLESKQLHNFIIDHSEICLAISEYMALDYFIKYNREFSVFSNSVEACNIPALKKDNNKCYTITYIGKIQHHNLSAILNTAKAVEFVNTIAEGRYNIRLDIYSNVDRSITDKLMSICSSSNIMSWVNHDEIINILKNSDILLLPISMDKSVVKYVKYSMSTKIAEYLSVGVPILYIGPNNIAMTKFFIEKACACVITDINTNKISNAIKMLIEDNDYTKFLKDNSIKIFNNYFERNKVSNDFFRLIFDNYNRL